MKRKWIAVVLFFLCGGTAVFAADLGVAVGVMGFDSALNGLSGQDAGIMSVGVFGNARAGFDISENMEMTVTVDHDPILKTRIMPVLGLTYNVITLKVGPFMGFSDIREIDVNPGISMSLDVAAPGIVFGSLRFDTTIGGGGIAPRNFVQELWEARAGFWTPHVIFSLGAQNRAFTEQRDAEIHTGKWTRYIFSMDFFQKNVPRTWRFDLGFQQLKWTPHNRPEEGYEYGSFFLGAEFHIQANYAVEVVIGGEGSVFSWNTQSGIGGGSKIITLFETRLGINWTIGK